MDHASVGGPDPDHLAEIVAADQLGISGQLAHRDRDRDAQRDERDHQQIEGDLEAGDDDPPEAGRWDGAGH